MSSARGSRLGVVCILSLGCSATPTTPTPATVDPYAAVSSPLASASTPAPREIPPPLLAWMGEVAEASDVHTLAYVSPNPPPKPWTPLPEQAKAPFPGKPFVRVRGFVFRQAKWDLRLDSSVEGCAASALAKDGSLCPSVKVPGGEVDPELAARIVAVASAPAADEDQSPPGPPTTREYHYAHAFVFYDDKDRPVGQIAVSFKPGKLMVSPLVRSIHRPSASTMQLFLDACRAAKLPLCDGSLDLDSYDPDVVNAARTAAQIQYTATHPPRTWPASTPLADLDLGARRELCLQQLDAHHNFQAHGYECENGLKYTLGDWAGISACDATPPAGVTVGDVLALTEAFPDPPYNAQPKDMCDMPFAERQRALDAVKGYTFGIPITLVQLKPDE
ncbi:MAG: hypothetical protein U0414_25130 [Polyangiaceae bacterium]